METKKLGVKYDSLLLLSITALVFIGVVMVYSASSIYSKEHFGSQYFFLNKHLVFVLLGIASLVVGAKVNHGFLRKMTFPFILLSFFTLLFLLVSSHGVLKSGAASRWINLFSISFQPAELAKLALILFLANYMSKIGDKITTFKEGFLPCVLVPGVFILLILKQPDFGTAVTISAIVFLMLFVAGVKKIYLLGTLLATVPPLAFIFLRSGYRLKRILAFVDPWKDPLGSGFQMIQSFIAFSNGGFFGAGLGDGKQKLLYLPEAHTDFIFSVIGEELGFLGVTLVVILFSVYIYKGFSVSLKVRDSFAVLLATGITAMIGVQAFVNIGVTLGLLPTKGLTLPFISYGGTSLVMTMFASGLLLNLSSKTNQLPVFNYARRV